MFGIRIFRSSLHTVVPFKLCDGFSTTYATNVNNDGAKPSQWRCSASLLGGVHLLGSTTEHPLYYCTLTCFVPCLSAVVHLSCTNHVTEDDLHPNPLGWFQINQVGAHSAKGQTETSVYTHWSDSPVNLPLVSVCLDSSQIEPVQAGPAENPNGLTFVSHRGS